MFGLSELDNPLVLDIHTTDVIISPLWKNQIGNQSGGSSQESSSTTFLQRQFYGWRPRMPFH